MADLFSLLGINRVQPPKGGPPNYTPDKNKGKKVGASNTTKTSTGGPSVKAVDPGAIFPCINQFVYIWPSNGPGFWAYVTYVGPNSIAGWRIIRRRWQYFGLDLKKIDEFYCA